MFTGKCMGCAVEYTRRADKRGKYCTSECAWKHQTRRGGKPGDPVSRFNALVDRSNPDGCWEFQGFRDRGYGIFNHSTARPQVRAHRYAWEQSYGPVPLGKLVCHKCDNRPCCRPDHLFLGSSQDNVNDMMSKGRGSSGHIYKTPEDKLAVRRARNRRKYASRKARGYRRGKKPPIAP